MHTPFAQFKTEDPHSGVKVAPRPLGAPAAALGCRYVGRSPASSAPSADMSAGTGVRPRSDRRGLDGRTFLWVNKFRSSERACGRLGTRIACKVTVVRVDLKQSGAPGGATEPPGACGCRRMTGPTPHGDRGQPGRPKSTGFQTPPRTHPIFAGLEGNVNVKIIGRAVGVILLSLAAAAVTGDTSEASTQTYDPCGQVDCFPLECTESTGSEVCAAWCPDGGDTGWCAEAGTEGCGAGLSPFYCDEGQH